MNPFFKQQLETAQKANGITFDVLTDWADLLDLSRLADVVTNAEETGSAAILRPCVEIGGVLFYRPTIGAGEWLAERAAWFDSDPAGNVLCMAYACAGAREPERLLWPHGADKTRLDRTLKAWRKSLGCTPEELSKWLGEFLVEGRADTALEPAPGGEESAPVKSGYGHFIDLLLSEYGGTPEQWIWHTPRETCLDLIAKIAERHRAKAGKAYTDPNAPSVIASHRFVMRLQAIVAKKKEAAHGS